MFSQIFLFVDKYKNLPTKETIVIELGNRTDLREEDFKATIRDYLQQLDPEEVELEWLFDTTEKWCKDRAIHNAVLSGIKILDKQRY